MATKFEVKIEDNVEIPKREVNFGPRGSKYPILDMKEGQSFALTIVGKENQKSTKGEPLTVKQDAERKARQKQSYFSGFGKRNGLSIVTRYNPETGELRVWHNGPATEKDKTENDEAKTDGGAGATPAANTPAQTSPTQLPVNPVSDNDMELE